MKNKIIIILAVFAVLVVLGSMSVASAVNATICCEKTKSTYQHGVQFCQNVPAEECDPTARKVPTACESTSYCRPGTCYNSHEGTCLDNTPEITCVGNGGTWSEQPPAQCELGCCILGDQAAFVSLVRCKRLSGMLGLETNYKPSITNEVQCILEVQNQERGACVYTREFEKTCTMTTRAACSTITARDKNSTGLPEFFPGKLCTAESIGAPCGPTNRTACIPGRDEVYFVDSCGNTANIFDAAKRQDANYWTNIVDKAQSCALTGSNARSCGNCNYIDGTYCRELGRDKTPTCDDLNCKASPATGNKPRKHGESWCAYNDQGPRNTGDSGVGSRFYKHVCVNGDAVVEQCADFRQEECIEDSIALPEGGTFAQAACRVNRWQDCTKQRDKADCENTDRRDCLWRPPSKQIGDADILCIPKNPPGLKFWQGEETQNICNQGSVTCVVVFKKNVFGSETCDQNCECLTAGWKKERENICKALGDCGPKVNWLGTKGYKEGINISQRRE